MSRSESVEQTENSLNSKIVTRKLYQNIQNQTIIRRTSSFGGGPVMIQQTSKPIQDGKRWIILFLSSLLLFGNFYAFDNPAALNSQLQLYLGHDYDTWQYELNLLYSVYSFPNMFLPFLGGQLIDRFDSRYVLLVLSSVICIGQTIFALGVTTRDFNLMLIGRTLFGIGGECVSVVQASITTTWFQGKELAFALGMNLCIGRLGSMLNSISSPRISSALGLLSAIWIGSFFVYISFVAAIILAIIISLKKPEPDATPLLFEAMQQSPTQEDGDEVVDVRYLPISFWVLCTLCITLYGTVIPFNTTLSDFLMSKWYPGDPETAGLIMGIPDLLSAFVVPFFGYVVDRYGHRVLWLFFCSLGLAFSHLLLGLSDLTPIVGMVILGLSYSIYGAVLWPSVATCVNYCELLHETKGIKLKILGTAFGISTSALNVCLTILPIFTAQIHVIWQGFLPVELFYAGLGGIGTLLTVILYVLDTKNNNILERADSSYLHQNDNDTTNSNLTDDDEQSSLLHNVNRPTINLPEPSSLQLPESFSGEINRNSISKSLSVEMNRDSISFAESTSRSFLSPIPEQYQVMGTSRFYSRSLPVNGKEVAHPFEHPSEDEASIE
ncbi:hypothetical protein HDV06_006843 [Boothiomyces sp. JEL0866]|nr:hypothetical protein HDV06_006843 [Boothiomyces sp. JEL0866]